MNKVISFGDSFTWGTDLCDYSTKTPSQFTWPSLLAKHLNVTYQSFSTEGASNQSILRQLLSNFGKLNNTLVILNWTWIDRWDFYDLDLKQWDTLRPTGTEKKKFSNIYYKYFQSELWDKLESLKSINLALELLDSKNIPYISTCVDSLLIDKKFHNPKYIDFLINNIYNKLLWFNSEGFYNWSKSNNFPISDSWHPLEKAHQMAFEYIINNYEFT